MSCQEISLKDFINNIIPNVFQNLEKCKLDVENSTASAKVQTQLSKLPFLQETQKQLSSYRFILQSKLELLGEDETSQKEIQALQSALEQTQLMCNRLLNTFKNAQFEGLNLLFLKIINSLHDPNPDLDKIDRELQKLLSDVKYLGNMDPDQKENCNALVKNIDDNLTLVAKRKTEQELAQLLQTLSLNENNNNSPIPAPVLSQLEEFPDETLLRIIGKLPLKALLVFCSVSKRFNALRNVADLHILWNAIKSKIPGAPDLKTAEEISEWMEKHPEAFVNITELELSRKNLTSLPSEIRFFTNLQELELNGNQLQNLPEAIGNLTKLQKLWLLHNQLQSLPEVIGMLTNLRYLFLSNNRLQSLPKAIENLTKLRDLDLGKNQLQSFPEVIGTLTQLQELYLYQNQLQSCPEVIGTLTQLQTLSLGENQLQSLPEAIGNLIQLRYLVLNKNQLQSFPEVIGNLTQLQHVNLSDNQLQSLPESIGNLRLFGAMIYKRFTS